MKWYWIVIAVFAVIVGLSFIPSLYRCFFKRLYGIVLSAVAIIVLSPLFIILTAVGAIAMGGNPFFTQQRPGYLEKDFRLLKFRTMDNRKDENGNLLPDDVRLNRYGRIIRGLSLDELPQLINVFIGDMSFIGPRPLLDIYLPLYSAEQRRRHDVRPGISGWAQVNGRNAISWTEKFKLDVWYVDNMSLITDIKTIFKTVETVFKRSNIYDGSGSTPPGFDGTN